MVRAPCCEKMGMKKGPWTPEEDQILINYIHLYGHSNWRALPKHAGILRCGKSCRLRWINYLRPDIKRGNFTPQEEQTIIKLHHALGSRWSAIAAKLPGRTDNEIKNVWHTHLKKRLNKYQNKDGDTKDLNLIITDNINEDKESVVALDDQISLQEEFSNSITTFDNKNDMMSNKDISALVDDESFWLDNVVSLEYSNKNSKLYNHDMEFWFQLFANSHKIEEFSYIPEF